ncbi:MAG: hypothetical protein IH891_10715, partial [Planctomycetes bacterium]|nr:hypothetical protein [Planctomycetota bacterium]
LDELTPLIERDFVNSIEADRYRQKLVEAEAEVLRRELDLKETRLTGRAPVDDLSGPLVGDEDFIKQRLESRIQAVDLELKIRMDKFHHAETLVQKGFGSEHELILARANREEAEQALRSLQERIMLRRSFIRGELAAAEVDLRALQRDTEGELLVAVARLRVAQLKLQQATALHERSAVSSRELREAQAGVRDAESNLALAEVQLKMIRQRLEAIKQQD